jgi:hypothetical protein
MRIFLDNFEITVLSENPKGYLPQKKLEKIKIQKETNGAM